MEKYCIKDSPFFPLISSARAVTTSSAVVEDVKMGNDIWFRVLENSGHRLGNGRLRCAGFVLDISNLVANDYEGGNCQLFKAYGQKSENIGI